MNFENAIIKIFISDSTVNHVTIEKVQNEFLLNKNKWVKWFYFKKFKFLLNRYRELHGQNKFNELASLSLPRLKEQEIETRKKLNLLRNKLLKSYTDRL